MRPSKSALQKKTSAEWIEILNKAGIPCGPIYKIDEVFADPQVKHLGVATPVEHPEARPQADPGERRRAVAHAGEGGGADARRSASTPTRSCSELEYNAAEIAKLTEGGVV